MAINKVAVIGAGVMGSGIAAHFANAGVPVILLDIVPKGADNRNIIAETAIAKMLKTDPAPFMHPKCAKLITPGNLEDHLELLKDVDWVVEAVLEDIAIKADLYQKLETVCRPDCIISSNTSTIPLQYLTRGRSKNFQEHFLITHFFNPPRYMRLLELVKSEVTKKDVFELVKTFCDQALGKGVVECKDTPGFIANRIGTYWILCAAREAIDLGLTVEEADMIMSKPVGIPKTGIFGLVDLVGLDLMPHIGKSMLQVLPKDDDFRRIYREEPLFLQMIKEGYTGRKGKGGFYRLNRDNGGKVKESINLQTGAYAPSTKPHLPSLAGKVKLSQLIQGKDKASTYARRVLAQTLNYAASLLPEITDHVYAIDEAMRLGYNWKKGPFELMDEIGHDVLVAAITSCEIKPAPFLTKNFTSFYEIKEGEIYYQTLEGGLKTVPKQAGVLRLADIKLKAKPLRKNPSASVWDIGDGVLCFEFTSKMNALDNLIMDLLLETISLIKDNQAYKALVIYNEGSHFSAGANLGMALFAANVGAWNQVYDMVARGQQVYKALKYAPFPVVGAPSGMALGGGCEILLHCDALQAHAETYVGLVEVGVGVIPAWGGCKELLQRWQTHKLTPRGPMPAVAKAFETISTAKVAKSAFEARDLFYVRETDGITMNRDRLLFDAKAKALSLVENYQAPIYVPVTLPGASGKTALDMAVKGFSLQGKLTPHDHTVADHLGIVLTGGEEADIITPVNEDDILALELDHFMQLIKTKPTLARVEHILETGKPLRN